MKQQIILSGLGGQGVLFATKILAETAVRSGYRVLVSETHGMAQRGGNVISHLKVFSVDKGGQDIFFSPLIKPGKADVLIAFHSESASLHRHFLKQGGKLICNDGERFDATSSACNLGNPLLANIITVGYAAAKRVLFCGIEDIKSFLRNMGGSRMQQNLRALEEGARLAGIV